jgi:hypothetical protein
MRRRWWKRYEVTVGSRVFRFWSREEVEWALNLAGALKVEPKKARDRLTGEVWE